MPLEREQLGMAETMDVSPLPAAAVGWCAIEQGHGGGHVVVP